MTALLVAALLLAIVCLVMTRIEYDKLVQANHSLGVENDNLAEELDAEHHNGMILRNALHDIANQNQGQRTFDIWARQRASETLKLVDES